MQGHPWLDSQVVQKQDHDFQGSRCWVWTLTVFIAVWPQTSYLTFWTSVSWLVKGGWYAWHDRAFKISTRHGSDIMMMSLLPLVKWMPLTIDLWDSEMEEVRMVGGWRQWGCHLQKEEERVPLNIHSQMESYPLEPSLLTRLLRWLMNFGDIEKVKGFDIMTIFWTDNVIKTSLYFTFMVKTWKHDDLFIIVMTYFARTTCASALIE